MSIKSRARAACRALCTAALCGAVLCGAVSIGTVSAEPQPFSRAANEFVSDINCGWNLGNGLDSLPAGNETAWGNPTITKQLIDAIKARGFNAIRIPVSYDDAMGAAPDYTIRKSYLDRIQQVVDYAMDNDMFVFINAHHEKGWLSAVITDSSGAIKQAEYEAMLSRFSALWTQVATRFRDYGERLVMAGMNEIGAGGYTASEQQLWDGINTLNQTFFDAVRATGGNNERRYLVVLGPGAGIAYETRSMLRLPTGAYDRHIIFEFHAYIPRKFCCRPSSSSSVDRTDFSRKELEVPLYAALDECMPLLNAGVPVIIGEMGAVDKENEQERIRFVSAFIDIIGDYGVKAFWWDNGAFGYNRDSSTYGLIDRNSCEWRYGGIADAMIEHANAFVGVVYPSVQTTEATTAAATTNAITEATTTETRRDGDANDDGEINAKDVLIIRQHLADWSVRISAAADVTADGSVDAKDLLRMRLWLADYDVPLGKTG